MNSERKAFKIKDAEVLGIRFEFRPGFIGGPDPLSVDFYTQPDPIRSGRSVSGRREIIVLPQSKGTVPENALRRNGKIARRRNIILQNSVPPFDRHEIIHSDLCRGDIQNPGRICVQRIIYIVHQSVFRFIIQPCARIDVPIRQSFRLIVAVIDCIKIIACCQIIFISRHIRFRVDAECRIEFDNIAILYGVCRQICPRHLKIYGIIFSDENSGNVLRGLIGFQISGFVSVAVFRKKLRKRLIPSPVCGPDLFPVQQNAERITQERTSYGVSVKFIPVFRARIIHIIESDIRNGQFAVIRCRKSENHVIRIGHNRHRNNRPRTRLKARIASRGINIIGPQSGIRRHFHDSGRIFRSRISAGGSGRQSVQIRERISSLVVVRNLHVIDKFAAVVYRQFIRVRERMYGRRLYRIVFRIYKRRIVTERHIASESLGNRELIADKTYVNRISLRHLERLRWNGIILSRLVVFPADRIRHRLCIVERDNHPQSAVRRLFFALLRIRHNAERCLGN